MKSITIIGHLGKDAQKIKDDKNIFFSVATVNKSKAGNTTDWFNCYSSTYQYENLFPYLKSGQQVCIMGNLYFEDYMGTKQPKINVTHIELVGSKPKQESNWDASSQSTTSQPNSEPEEQPKFDFLKRKKEKQ